MEALNIASLDVQLPRRQTAPHESVQIIHVWLESVAGVLAQLLEAGFIDSSPRLVWGTEVVQPAG